MLLEGWGDKPGLIAGHEFSGTIVALGEGVEGWEIGETVVGGPSPKCGQCRRCLEGKPSQCENRRGSIADGHDGAFARYVLVRAVSLVRLPPGLTARKAALAEPLAVALHGITRSGVSVGDTVMVIGAGPIGALSIAALVARGIGPVIAVEPGERRKELARKSRCLRGARSRRPRGLSSVGARADLRPRCARGTRVLGQEGGHGGRVPPAGSRGHPGPGGCRHRTPEVRPQPVRPQRAQRGGFVHLRQGGFRAGARPAVLRRIPDRAADRGRGRAVWT